MQLILLKTFSLFIIIFSFIGFTTMTFGDAFKCVDKEGNTIFQDIECGDLKTETKIEIKKYQGNTHCAFNCDAIRAVCVADLGDGKNNTGRGVLLCEQEKQVCNTRCYNPSTGRELEVMTAIERANYERELRKKEIQKKDKTSQIAHKKRMKEWELKRKQRHCRRYERKLAKIKGRWERKQRSGWKPRDEEYYLVRIADAEDEVRIECQ